MLDFEYSKMEILMEMLLKMRCRWFFHNLALFWIFITPYAVLKPHSLNRFGSLGWLLWRLATTVAKYLHIERQNLVRIMVLYEGLVVLYAPFFRFSSLLHSFEWEFCPTDAPDAMFFQKNEASEKPRTWLMWCYVMS